jgi:hypothetical protein
MDELCVVNTTFNIFMRRTSEQYFRYIFMRRTSEQYFRYIFMRRTSEQYFRYIFMRRTSLQYFRYLLQVGGFSGFPPPINLTYC